jgi:hypothetical protein
MFQEHCRRMERVLESQAMAAGIFDHPDNIGGARELLVSQFLKNNLPPHLRLWTGEIIDHTVTPANQERRHQVDLAVARDDVPVFLVDENGPALMPCEAVLATIEVKSRLTKQHAFGAFKAIQAWRGMDRTPFVGISSGNTPRDRIVNYIFAFAGPTIQTLIAYMQEFSQVNGVPLGSLFDVCVVLKQNIIFVNDGVLIQEQGEHSHLWLDQEQDNLFMFMISLFRCASGFVSTPPNLERYFGTRRLQPRQSGFLG